MRSALKRVHVASFPFPRTEKRNKVRKNNTRYNKRRNQRRNPLLFLPSDEWIIISVLLNIPFLPLPLLMADALLRHGLFLASHNRLLPLLFLPLQSNSPRLKPSPRSRLDAAFSAALPRPSNRSSGHRVSAPTLRIFRVLWLFVGCSVVQMLVMYAGARGRRRG